MEHLVAVAVELDDGEERFFMTWGRIQDEVDDEPLAALVLRHADSYDLGGRPTRARVCVSLQEACQERYFFEAVFELRTSPSLGATSMPLGGPGLLRRWSRASTSSTSVGSRRTDPAEVALA